MTIQIGQAKQIHTKDEFGRKYIKYAIGKITHIQELLKKPKERIKEKD